MRGKAIYYGGDDKGRDNRRDGKSKAQSFICASDASFINNSVDRKSLQGYIIKLFRGPIAWRANKQDMVIILSIEAKLLALSQTAKKNDFY